MPSRGRAIRLLSATQVGRFGTNCFPLLRLAFFKAPRPPVRQAPALPRLRPKFFQCPRCRSGLSFCLLVWGSLPCGTCPPARPARRSASTFPRATVKPPIVLRKVFWPRSPNSFSQASWRASGVKGARSCLRHSSSFQSGLPPRRAGGPFRPPSAAPLLPLGGSRPSKQPVSGAALLLGPWSSAPSGLPFSRPLL